MKQLKIYSLAFFILLMKGELQVRIQTEGEGGIAVYGKEFGRYALDPTLLLEQ